MNPPRILLIDPDQKNVRILRNNFLDLHYEVDAAGSDAEAVEKITAQPFDAVLTEVAAPGIDGYQLLEQTQQSTLNRSCAVIFLTQKSDVWNRVKSFKLGAKDYIIKPIHVREIVGRVQMVLARRERRRQALKSSRKQFSGRLADLGAVELIEAFGAERKSGVLTLSSENGASGRMVFKEGAVIQATAGLHRSEEAVLKLLSWNKGRFSMVFAPVDEADEIGVSNMGLLLQGAKRMEQRELLLKDLPALEAVLVTTANFKKIIARKELASDLEYFVSLFDGERSLGRIIDESKYDEITTLERIRKLYELGFLHSLRDYGSGQETTSAQERTPLPAVGEEALAPEVAGGWASDSMKKPEATEGPAVEHILTHDWERIETKLEAAGAEDLLHEVIGEPEPQDAAEVIGSPALDADPGESHRDAELEAFEHLTPDLSVWNGDNSYDTDLFYDLRHAEQEGRDLFSDSKGTEGGSLFPDLERITPQHPADALLQVEADDDKLEESELPEEEVEETFSSYERVPVASLPAEPVDVSDEDEHDVRELERNLHLQEKFRHAHGSILILGNNRELCRQMVASLSAGQVQEKSAFQPKDSDMTIGTAEFKGGHLLNLIAISLEREFAPVIDYFAGSLLGFILLIDGRNVDWSYQQYLRQVLKEKTNLPAVVVFSYNEYLKKPMEESLIRRRLGLGERDGLQLVSDYSVVNSRRIVFHLFETFYRPRARQSQPAGTMQPSPMK
jgi:DNA-binding response OmpR family regulator